MLGWNRLGVVLVVELFQLAIGHHLADHIVHRLLDGGVVLAELNGNGLSTDHFTHDLETLGVLALCNHASEHVVVQHKGIHTA